MKFEQVRRAAVAMLLGFAVTTCSGGPGGGPDGPPPEEFNQARGLGGQVHALLAVGDKLYVGGDFDSFNAAPAGRLAVFSADQNEPIASAELRRGFNGPVRALAATRGGLVYVGGGFSQFNTATAYGLARLRPNHTLDTAFDVGDGFRSQVNAIALMKDGTNRVVVGGAFVNYQLTTAGRIVRLLPNGTRDPDFNVGAGFGNGEVNSLATLASGHIYAAGSFTRFNGEEVGRIVRLKPDGTRDTTFNPGEGASTTVSAICVAPNGRIYVGGGFSRFNGLVRRSLVRLLDTGEIDTSFDIGNGFNNLVYALHFSDEGGGRLYVAGGFTTYRGTPALRVARLQVNGNVDPQFTAHGTVYGSVYAISPVPGARGSVAVGGNIVTAAPHNVKSLLRLNSMGHLVPWLPVGTGLTGGRLVRMHVTPGPRPAVYAAGFFTHYNGFFTPGLVRLTSDGHRDPQFDVGTGFEGTVRVAAESTDGGGTVYAVGNFLKYQGHEASRIVRLLHNGTRDTRFAIGSGLDQDAAAMATHPRGGVYVGGTFTTYNGEPHNRIARILPSGEADSTFLTGSGFNSSVSTILVDPLNPDQVYVSGSFTHYQDTPVGRIVRLKADGSIDESFNTGTGFGSTVYAITLAPGSTGAIYVVGAFKTFNGADASGVVRLGADGSRDFAFDPGRGPSVDAVHSVAVVPDGSNDILIGGSFTTYNLIPARYLVRVNASGSIANGWQDRLWTTAPVFTLTAGAPNSGKVYVGGVYSLNSVTVDQIARLGETGAVE